ncbi:MAG: methionyl-tRNA formyltransferase [Burkholderiaceae bacterium]|nr:MAG: methionyl-tRNA formyltransferase [Burkholderiaceae bacterium]
MKIIFAGTPEFAAAALQALLDARMNAQLDVIQVLTQPDRPAGRGLQLQPSAIKQLALKHQLPVFQPKTLRDETVQAQLRALDADVMVVAAYGLILPQAVLDMPRHGCLNIHASLLPRWRGAAPIHRAIEAGDAETGITIMQMDAGLDTGAMLLTQSLPIAADDTTATLHDNLAPLGGRLMVQALQQLQAGILRATPQPEAGVTYAHKILKEEATLDWTQSAEVLARRIRAFNPFPGATGQMHDTTIKLWQAHVVQQSGTPGTVLQADAQGIVVACGTQALRLETLQRPGGKKLPAANFLQGLPVPVGAQFT